MSIARMISAMRKAGVSAEQIATTIEIMETEREAEAREATRQRVNKHRQKLRENNSHVTDVTVTSVTPPIPPMVSPAPLPSPPLTPQTPKAPLPDWLNLEAWSAFLDMRRSIRAPMSTRAQQLGLAKLDRFRQSGHDPTAILEKSTLNGWRDLFEPKPESRASPFKPAEKRTGATTL